MTEQKNASIQYLDRDDIELIHSIVSEREKKEGEPIPPFSHANKSDIDVLVHIPRSVFDGKELYPSIAEKAAIIFYTVNKRQIFVNGNKRMSTACLLVFLDINGKRLNVSPDELTQKALWLANTSSQDFQTIKSELILWLASHITDQTVG
jgi:death on curing protein